jgi:hypothetical protein
MSFVHGVDRAQLCAVPFSHVLSILPPQRFAPVARKQHASVTHFSRRGYCSKEKNFTTAMVKLSPEAKSCGAADCSERNRLSVL